ncbi:MarR family winged helix-turn-helix transcriptional regulator [Actinokineospora sp. UTMC 2448]|uniref:MarR family winged helix-turn-helix transcriptional regulator n=1 Tax=Actinokineospora sp. UTMC 2448 TaxID=2268449 RepID=UPI0021644F41|nr:MarR family transcriptional regulator [Actinokineospora sp. UTMC 2448]UVS78570.1 transcriptional regulator SlyA [Actinokineospora sp. UTMC 2448]
MAGHRASRLVGGDLVDLLTRAQRALVRDLGTVLEEEGFTVDQWRVLRALAAQERSMGELAAAVEIPHPTLTRMVDALVDSALLYRSQSEEDRRRVSVHVSALGRAKLDRLESLTAAHERTLAARVGTDTVTQLTHLLRDLA